VIESRGLTRGQKVQLFHNLKLYTKIKIVFLIIIINYFLISLVENSKITEIVLRNLNELFCDFSNEHDCILT